MKDHTDQNSEQNKKSYGFAGNVAKVFLQSKITPLLIIASLFLGIVSVVLTPKEEDPQVVVPMIDIFIPYPGAVAKDIERTISSPLEKLIWEIPGVEYVYSTSMNDMGMIVVRFEVGLDEEESVVKLKTKIDNNMDRIPKDALRPIIKKVSINDVPQMGITLWSNEYSAGEIRQVAAEVLQRLKEIPDISQTELIGGYKRTIRVEPQIEQLKSRGLDLFKVFGSLQMSNKSLNTGEITTDDELIYISAGGFFKTVEDVKNAVVGVHNGKAVYLRDIAEVTDSVEVPKHYHFMGFNKDTSSTNYQAVTISISKRKGSDSVVVAREIEDRFNHLKKYIIPTGINTTITKNYGDTAYEKVKVLMEHLLGAIIAVILVMTLAMGWRAGFVVFVALPVTFALTLFVYYMFDYTLNRVTMFALIFVAGLVVDDAIIVVENMERHFKKGKDRLVHRALVAVGEVGNPTILATLTVIVALYPMAFVRGLMGPYMKPMPVGASLAMLFSLGVALIVTPWLAYKLLAGHGEHEVIEDQDAHMKSTRMYKLYVKLLKPLMESFKNRFIFGIVVVGMFIGSFMFIPTDLVIMKMLPFDNKNELQIIIDMPEGTALETTNAVALEIGSYLSTVKEVENYQIYSGISGPFNFNGLVRHYFLRKGGNVADIQVNFVSSHDRDLKSHDLAKILRKPVQDIGERYGANIKMAEVPPGPPVLSTLVAEIYGPDEQSRIDVASRVMELFEKTEGVVDVDWYYESDMREFKFEVDKEKAALTGVSSEKIAQTLYMALRGMKSGVLHTGEDIEDVDIIVKLPEDQKTSIESLHGINIASMNGQLIPLIELVNIKEKVKEKAIYHKNLQPVMYVVADVAGGAESPVYAILNMKDELSKLTFRGEKIPQLWTSQPKRTDKVSIKWDGEWQVTYEVFRDLGLAFAGAMIVMYFLLVGWFRSFTTPIIMMVPIPLSLIGIIPGHFIFGEFFTATSMIGFMALAGIMVRNAVLIIDFIEASLAEGKDLKDAVIESGAIRTRPVVLTTIAVVAGALFMLPDPIFAGLGVSLITGAVVSTMLTLIIIPLMYYKYYEFTHRIK